MGQPGNRVMGDRVRALGTWEWRGKKETNPKDAILLYTNPTCKAHPTGQPAPGKGKFGCWEVGRLMQQTPFHGGGRSSVLADKPPLGQEPHQAADGKNEMVVQLEPPHIGAPAALVL